MQYRAAKLTTCNMHISSQVKLEAELGWETIETRADMSSLNIFNRPGVARAVLQTPS